MENVGRKLTNKEAMMKYVVENQGLKIQIFKLIEMNDFLLSRLKWSESEHTKLSKLLTKEQKNIYIKTPQR